MERADRFAEMSLGKRKFLRAVFYATGVVFKVLTSFLGGLGIAIFIEAVAIYKSWKEVHPKAQLLNLWFVLFLLGLGLYFCLAAVIGILGAQSKWHSLLGAHLLLGVSLLIAEGALVAMYALDESFEEKLPEERTGKLKEFMEIVSSHQALAKWCAAALAGIQGLGVCLALALIQLPNVSEEDCEEDEAETLRRPILQIDEVDPSRGSPRLQSPRPGSSCSRDVSPHMDSASSGEQWSRHMLEKYGLDTTQFQYNPERQQPVIASEESGPQRRRCIVM